MYVYWVVFIFIGSFVLLSLFIGAITIGMQSSMDEAKEDKHALEAEKKAVEREKLHDRISRTGVADIHALWTPGTSAEAEELSRLESESEELLWLLQLLSSL